MSYKGFGLKGCAVYAACGRENLRAWSPQGLRFLLPVSMHCSRLRGAWVWGLQGSSRLLQTTLLDSSSSSSHIKRTLRG